jgi:hypothetical protein
MLCYAALCFTPFANGGGALQALIAAHRFLAARRKPFCPQGPRCSFFLGSVRRSFGMFIDPSVRGRAFALVRFRKLLAF